MFRIGTLVTRKSSGFTGRIQGFDEPYAYVRKSGGSGNVVRIPIAGLELASENPQTELVTPYAIGDGDGFVDLACETCAVDYAEQHELTWNSPSHGYTEEEQGCYAYEASYEGEADQPSTCGGCGVYLATTLTRYGLETLLDQHLNYPKFVLDYYLDETA